MLRQCKVSAPLPLSFRFTKHCLSDQKLANAYSKLEYLQNVHEIKLVAGDHAFRVEFRNFYIFDLLPSRTELEATKNAQEVTEDPLPPVPAEEEKEKEVKKTEEELRLEALQQMKIAASKKAKQDGKVLLKVVLLGNEG